MRDEPSLVRRAVTLLQRGEVHTLDLAREVLGLKGDSGAASAAISSLLGADPRLQVDGQGCWSLAGEAPIPEEELDALTLIGLRAVFSGPQRTLRLLLHRKGSS